MAKARHDHHVPYRDTIITRMLRDTLEAECTTVVLACLNPGTDTMPETKNVLKFMERAAALDQKKEGTKARQGSAIMHQKRVLAAAAEIAGGKDPLHGDKVHRPQSTSHAHQRPPPPASPALAVHPKYTSPRPELTEACSEAACSRSGRESRSFGCLIWQEDDVKHLLRRTETIMTKTFGAPTVPTGALDSGAAAARGTWAPLAWMSEVLAAHVMPLMRV